MKCDTCGNEIALAKVCPYCGSRVNAHDVGEPKRERPSGAFRGRVDEREREGEQPPPAGVVGRLVRFFLEPRIPAWQKSLAIIALFYVVSPLDLMPGLALPVLGWLDDLAVLAFAWRWIASALNALDR